jgi:hypothetical protein
MEQSGLHARRKKKGRRRIGRPKLSWIDRVLENVKKLGVKNWLTVATNGGSLQKCLSGSQGSHWAVELLTADSTERSS